MNAVNYTKDSCLFICISIHRVCSTLPLQVPVIWGTVWWSYKVGTDCNPDPEPWILLPAGCVLQSGQEAAGTAALSGDGGTATVTMPQCTSNTKDSINSPLLKCNWIVTSFRRFLMIILHIKLSLIVLLVGCSRLVQVTPPPTLWTPKAQDWISTARDLGDRDSRVCWHGIHNTAGLTVLMFITASFTNLHNSACTTTSNWNLPKWTLMWRVCSVITSVSLHFQVLILQMLKKRRRGFWLCRLKREMYHIL